MKQSKIWLSVTIGFLFLLIILFFVFFSIKSVPAGYVGIKVNLYGSEKGVQNQEVGVGRKILTFNEELFLFPTFNQLHNYETPFYFQNLDAMKIGVSIGMEYRVNPDKVANVFQTYRKGVDDITNGSIRQRISDSLLKQGAKLNINQISGEGMTKLLDVIENDVREGLAPVGIDIIKLSWTGGVMYPDEVTTSINAKNEATQRAMRVENEIVQTKAEAQKKIEEARGEAESIMIKAKAESDAILIRAEGETNAIKLRGEALKSNPEVLNLEAINRWDGKVPVYMTSGAQTPLISLPAPVVN